MITAAAHAGFHAALHRLDVKADPSSWVSELLEGTNHAVYVSAKNESEMSFAVAVVDFENGRMAYGSAGHHPQYLQSGTGAIKALLAQQAPQLGKAPVLGTRASTVDLQPGDRVIWYTDGLVEGNDAKGEAIGKARFQRAIRAAKLESSDGAVEWLEKVIEGTVGCKSSALPELARADDITVIALQFKARIAARSDSGAPVAPPPFSPKSEAA